MFKSKKNLRKTIDEQQKRINDLKEKMVLKDLGVIEDLKTIKDVNNTKLPRKNNYKFRQELINKTIDRTIEKYK